MMELSKFSLLAVSFYLSSLQFILGDVDITGVQCQFNGKFCNPSYCKMSSTRGKMKYLSVNCNIVEPIDNVWVQTQIFRKLSNGKTESFSKMVSKNLCKYTDFNGDNYFVNRLMSLASKHINKYQCPYKGNISLTKMPMMLHIGFGLFPQGSFVHKSYVYNNVGKVLDLNISFAVQKKKTMTE